ncbi:MULTISPECIES: S8 family peptidase [Streptomyces]|uniref:S8 family peptidase n=1 Tax=Streptomyces TaxID=1883 RepID=UPI001E632334|nr:MULTISPECIES: S8 family serine peptidase [Streptomyces]UFQ17683.1 S8 family serine peptidase [Streptomyces huasconensis]WCL87290.1 S8 family serine peptidase [Streptomyces sp. JCM 35825]
MKRAGGATVAVAVAVALAAGMTGPAAADPAARPAGAHEVTGRTAGAGHVTLITGDRAVLDAKGRVIRLDRAKGREHIPVQVRRKGGHTLLIPADAVRLIADGKVDQRLFDVTELNNKRNRAAQKKGLKVIVGYKGAATAAKAEVRSAGDTTVRRTLKSLNADAVTTPKRDAADLWAALTSGKGDARTAASGIGHVWLDGVRKASLDKSVKQIGADKAWAAGYDGKGVKIAVLDTGVAAGHADLKGQVVAEKNFTPGTPAEDAADRYGHGTHVASTVAGTGATSGGKFKGVAPGAKLLNGKVLDDTGYGEDSGIIAAMDWAAGQGADIVNLSLGGGDTPGVDPLEAQVDKLSAEKGILFAISAGNDGEPGSVGSPGSADSALTVGAVDDNDKLADFSSQGPRIGDGAIKPDVTAPGVDITAASAPNSVLAQQVGESPAGYLTISGTSMAAPHVAGAAALLKQQHPDWKYSELKGALTASTKGGAYTPFQQGSGRIAVDRAIKQTVFAEPVSVNFGTQQWPHTDDKPVTKKVTYRNTGKTDVTLDVTVSGTDPKGRPAPAGFFALGAQKVTVPAGGTASVDLTADSQRGAAVDGAYSAYVVATGGGQTVRTAAAVVNEVESYDVTLKFIGRDGAPATYYDGDLEGISGLAAQQSFNPYDESGTVTVRVPKGGYLLNAGIYVDPKDFTKGADWIAQPKLNVTKDTTVTLDARTTKPVDITVPETGLKAGYAAPDYTVDTPQMSFTFGWQLDSYANFRTKHQGAQVTDGSLFQQWGGHWTKGDDTEYDIVTGGKVKEVATGYTKHFKAAELAKVKVNVGASSSGKKGVLSAMGILPGSSSGSSAGIPRPLPTTRTLYLSAVDKAEWSLDLEQHGTDTQGRPTVDAGYTLGAAQIFKGGQSYEKTFNTAVFGPRLGSDFGVHREGNNIVGDLPLFADGKGHLGSSLYTSVKTTLYRNGTKVGENEDPLAGGASFKVPSGDAAYELKTSVKRSVKVAAASTRIDAGFKFRSKRAESAKLPVSTARFAPAVDLRSRAEAGRTQSVPVTVQGSAAGANLKSLYVYVSYDYGQTWKQVKVVNGKISVKNPEKDKGISFHAKITDKKGNKSTLSIHNAYYGK